MNVVELAAKTGVSPYAIRYYTRIGLLTPARHSGNRYRRFTDADVIQLSFVRKAQKLGFTLREVRKIFQESRAGRTPCPLVREIVQRHVVENAKRMEEVAALQRNMERALRRWRKMPDRAPDGDAICHLIETHDRYEA
jgi:MerR family Zn(II)-responsive transcriptional regulator of zntA